MGTGSFQRVKRAGRGIRHPSLSNTEAKVRVELSLYSPPVPSWNVIVRTSPLSLRLKHPNAAISMTNAG